MRLVFGTLDLPDTELAPRLLDHPDARCGLDGHPRRAVARQARANAAAAGLAALPEATMGPIAAVYAERIAPYAHQRW